MNDVRLELASSASRRHREKTAWQRNNWQRDMKRKQKGCKEREIGERKNGSHEHRKRGGGEELEVTPS